MAVTSWISVFESYRFRPRAPQVIYARFERIRHELEKRFSCEPPQVIPKRNTNAGDLYTDAVSSLGPGPPATIVLLGASNLTCGLSTAVATLTHAQTRALRIVAALGFGRSYGLRSSVLGRSLCSILDCGVWEAIAADRTPPVLALITDVGNDIMYGVEPSKIEQWIETCIDRLVALPGGGTRAINLTALPMASIVRVRPWQYTVVKSVLFPARQIRFSQAMSRAEETQRRLEDVAARWRDIVTLVHHDQSWYGFDPIHIRRRHWLAAWPRFLGQELRASCVGIPWRTWLRLRLHRPETYAVFGHDRTHAQPLRLSSDLTIEMY